MDEMVLKAMLKWPNVPSCRGWLGLDGRGDWFMRDDRAQSCGPFAGEANGKIACAESKGSKLVHEGLMAFIGRNYASDDLGQWYFQNGPQRVYVELAHTPWVWRLDPNGSDQVMSHTGTPARVQAVLADEDGLIYLSTHLGLGLVHSQDMWLCANLIDQGQWVLSDTVRRQDLPDKFHFVRSPQASQT